MFVAVADVVVVVVAARDRISVSGVRVLSLKSGRSLMAPPLGIGAWPFFRRGWLAVFPLAFV